MRKTSRARSRAAQDEDDELEDRPRRRKRRKKRRPSIIKEDVYASRSHPLAVGWLDDLFSDYLAVMLILTFFCCEIALPLAVLGAITAAERDARRNAIVVIVFGMLRFLLVLCLIGARVGSRP